MVVDTSALVAYLLREPLAARILAALAADTPRLSPVSLVECTMVMQGRRGEGGVQALDELLGRFPFDVVSVTRAQASIAREAFRTFGKGRHPAALNLGDCFSYALAIARGEPLLFVGNDFSRTDVAAAPY